MDDDLFMRSYIYYEFVQKKHIIRSN